MAARLNRNHTEQVLSRIQLSNLVTRLQKNALRQLKNPNNSEEIISMSEGEIRSAIFLIERKLAKAEAPKNINLSGELKGLVVIPVKELESNGDVASNTEAG